MPTVRLADYVSKERIFWDLSAPDKAALLRELSDRIAVQAPGVDSELLCDLLEQRESIQSTGVGDGLALPHAMVPGTDVTALFVGRVDPPLDYDALDEAPVDLVFLLLSPSESLKEHVRLLARVARILGQHDLLEQLRTAAGADDVLRILLDEDSRHVY
jgi:PTS system nitrogen regulatory IIA component